MVIVVLWVEALNHSVATLRADGFANYGNSVVDPKFQCCGRSPLNSVPHIMDTLMQKQAGYGYNV